MKTVSGKTFIISCIVLLSAIFISACGDDNSSSVPDSSLESSSSVEDIESSSDAISSEASTQSSATEPYSSAKESSSSAVESSSSNGSSSSTATPSSPSTESSSSAVASAKDYCSTNFRYKYNHDDANKKFTIFEDYSYDECQHLNGNYTFAHIDEVLQHKRSYFFVGDTLVLIQNNEGDPDTATTVLVGGSANNLLGDWSFTTCNYEAGSISCNNKPKSYTIHYVFEADSQFVYYTLADGSCIPPESLMPSDGTLYKDESYTDTYAMLWLYNSIINIKKGDTKNISIYPFQVKASMPLPSLSAVRNFRPPLVKTLTVSSIIPVPNMKLIWTSPLAARFAICITLAMLSSPAKHARPKMRPTLNWIRMKKPVSNMLTRIMLKTSTSLRLA